MFQVYGRQQHKDGKVSQSGETGVSSKEKVFVWQGSGVMACRCKLHSWVQTSAVNNSPAPGFENVILGIYFNVALTGIRKHIQAFCCELGFLKTSGNMSALCCCMLTFSTAPAPQPWLPSALLCSSSTSARANTFIHLTGTQTGLAHLRWKVSVLDLLWTGKDFTENHKLTAGTIYLTSHHQHSSPSFRYGAWTAFKAAIIIWNDEMTDGNVKVTHVKNPQGIIINSAVLLRSVEF